MSDLFERRLQECQIKAGLCILHNHGKAALAFAVWILIFVLLIWMSGPIGKEGPC